MYYWGFWSANHSRGHIWAVFSLEEHTALWLVRSYSHRCTPGHLWGNWEITWWKGASLTSIMNEIETCKDQTGPQHIPSSILAGCGPDIHVFGVKIESPIFFHAQGGRHSWLWISQSSWFDYPPPQSFRSNLVVGVSLCQMKFSCTTFILLLNVSHSHPQ